MNEWLTFYINKKIYRVEIIRKNIKNIYLKLSRENVPVVIASIYEEKEKIFNFVKKHIESFINEMNKRKKWLKFSLEKNFAFIFGKKHKLVILNGFKEISFKRENNKLYIKCNVENEKEIKTSIKYFFANLLYKHLLVNQKKYEKILNMPAHEFKISEKFSTWATNNIKKRMIIYSLMLVHFEPEIINYVIVHELCHYFYPNHDKDFWLMVEKAMPNYKELRKNLKIIEDYH